MTVSQQVVFQQMVEGLFIRGIGEDLTPESKNAIKEAGIDLTKRLLPAYPIEIWEACLSIAAKQIYPKVPEPEAMFQLGERFIQGFAETIVGKALGQLIRIIGVHRAMKRFTQSLRSSNNFMEATAVPTGDNSYSITISNVHNQPGFMQGVMTAGSRFMGLKDPVMTIEKREGAGCVYSLKWTA
jgi:uncharacterized protein (TIGR02265 family)